MSISLYTGSNNGAHLIWSNNISDMSLSPLGGLTNLVTLYLHGNPVSDVSALSGLTNLRGIGLNRTAITDVSTLANLTNLTSVLLSENSISDISVLSGLTNLKRLYLYTNSISDISPLVANTGLGSGDLVDVRDNPLSTTSLNTHIPVLQDRGVDVRFGAGKPAVEEIELRLPYPENEDIVNGGRP